MRYGGMEIWDIEVWNMAAWGMEVRGVQRSSIIHENTRVKFFVKYFKNPHLLFGIHSFAAQEVWLCLVEVGLHSHHIVQHVHDRNAAQRQNGGTRVWEWGNGNVET